MATSDNLSADVDLPRRIILSISSDFGMALANAWLDRGLSVAGTFRTESAAVRALTVRGANIFHCDISNSESVRSATAILGNTPWDVLVVASGSLDPISSFINTDFDDWTASLDVNFTAPLRAVHGLLASRRKESKRGPLVLFFAGGGTNSAPTNYTAYTVAKIASIKLVELLDAEISDTRFSILGPGWVNTKIHEATFKAGERAGANFERARQVLKSEMSVPIERVIECCDWIICAPRAAIGGRNISLVHDPWRDPSLVRKLAADRNLYKLRRSDNDFPMESSDSIADRAVNSLNSILTDLSAHPEWHAPGSAIYNAISLEAKTAVATLFGPSCQDAPPFGPFGHVVLPYRRMGAVDSLDLFGLDELIIFSFYWSNRDKYRVVADIGANIGLHSLILARCGYSVRSYEPDPIHTAIFADTMADNNVTSVELFQAAVSNQAGKAEFLRVLGNTTSSHLTGAKAEPYGKIDRFPVPLISILEIAEWADLLKIDAEGHEAVIVLAITADQWKKIDALLEIGSHANAAAIFNQVTRLGLNIFIQKMGWARAESLTDLPTSYKDGTAFISYKETVPGFGAEVAPVV